MKIFRKFLAITLCFMMLLSSVAVGGRGFGEVLEALTVTAAAAGSITGECGGNAVFTFIPDTDDDNSVGTLFLAPAAGSAESGTPEVAIQATVEKFMDCIRKSARIVVSDGVTSIAAGCFAQAANLEMVTIPGSVRSIGEGAFPACVSDIYFCSSGWDTVTGGTALPATSSATVHTVFYQYFCGKDNLYDVCAYRFSDNGAIVFSGQGDIKGYNYSGDNISPWKEFNVRTAMIESGVTGIGSYVLTGSVERVFIPDTVTHIGSDAFYSAKLTSVVIPGSVTNISSFAFCRNNELSYVRIENGVQGIGDRAFFDCDLRSVYIPDSVTSISKQGVFGENDNLESITVSEGNSSYSSADGILYNKAKTELIICPSAKTGTLDVPSTVTKMDALALSRSKLSAVNIPASVTDISGDLLYVAGGLSWDGSDATSITSFNVASANPKYCSEDGVIFNKDKTELIVYPSGRAGSYSIPSTVTRINSHKFYSCMGLTGINIPGSVKTIDSSAFYSCRNLTKITIGNGTEEIGEYAFGNCASLEIIFIPVSLKKIDRDAFDGDRTISRVFYAGTGDQWSQIEGTNYIPSNNNIFFIFGFDAESACGESMNYSFFPETDDEDSTGTLVITGTGRLDMRYAIVEKFMDCIRKSVAVVFCPGVSYIPEGIFTDAPNLKFIEIPGTVTRIEAGAFTSCSALTDIYFAGDYSQWGAVRGGNGYGGYNVVTPGEMEPHYIKPAAYSNRPTHDEYGEGFSWTLYENGTLIIDGAGEMPYVYPSPWDYYKSDVKKAIIVPGITSISRSAFNSNGALSSVSIPSTVTSVGENAFYGAGLTSVEIPGSVTTIGNSAFRECRMESVTIPASVTSIGGYAFDDNKNLASINVDGNNPDYSSADGVLFSGDGKTLVKYPEGKESNLYAIPGGVSILDWFSISGCTNLSAVYVPASVISMRDGIFYESDNITDIYYEGTESQWNNISGVSSALITANAKIHCGVTSAGSFGDNITWKIEDGVLTVSGTGEMPYFHSSSETPWNQYGSIITKVVVGNGITKVNSHCFSGLPELTEATIGENVTTVANMAFYNCPKLTKVTLNKNVQVINSAFSADSALREIHLPVSVTDVTGICTNTLITDVYYDGTQTQWSNVAGSSAVDAIERVTVHLVEASGSCGDQGDNVVWKLISDGTLRISGEGNMADYSGATDPAYVTNYTNRIKSIVIEDNVTGIGSYAFCNLDKAKSITIGKDVTSIGEQAFAGCLGLTSIDIPASVTNIGNSAFFRCSALTAINVEEGSLSYSSADGILFNADGSVLVCYPAGKNDVTEYTVPETVTTIGSDAFSRVTGIQKVFVPGGVTELCDNAFFQCSSLREINITSPLTTIGQQAFYCDALEKIYLPNTVTSIGNNAVPLNPDLVIYYDGFRYEWDDIVLSEEAIPEGVEINILLGGYCGDSDSNEPGKNVRWILEGETLYIRGTGRTHDYNDILPTFNDRFDMDGFTRISKYTITKVVIEDGVTSIGDQMFRFMHELQEVVIGNDVETIGKRAFAGCGSLASVELPASVTSLGNWAFEDCGSLASVEISASVTSLGEEVFTGCSNLREITVDSENTVLKMDDGVLYSKDGTKLYCYVIKDPRNLARTQFTVPSTVKTISYSAFNGNTTLTKVYIPETVTRIGRNAFKNTTSMREIVVESPLTDIEESAFAYSTVKDLYLPGTLTWIGEFAFGGNNNIVIHYNDIRARWDEIRKHANALHTYVTLKCIPGGYCGTTADGADGKNLIWTCVGDVITIKGTGDMRDFSNDISAIPWKNYTDSTSVVVEEGVTSIGNWAFSRMSEMETVSLPDTLVSIGSNAFMGDTSLGTLTIPKSVTTLSNNPFNGCSGLTSITVDSENEVFDSRDNCKAIMNSDTNALVAGCANTVIPANTASIGNQAFYGIGLAETVTIPDGVTDIGDYAFGGNNTTGKVYIPFSVTSIGFAAFQECFALTDVYYAGTETDWEKILFDEPSFPDEGVEYHFRHGGYCGSTANGADGKNLIWSVDDETGALVISGTGLMADYDEENVPGWNGIKTDITSIRIENGVTSIGDRAFWGCSAAESVYIPSSVASIGKCAFAVNTSLSAFTVDENSQYFTTQGGVLFSKDMKRLVSFPAGAEKVTYDIPATVETIDAYAFAANSHITAVTVPSKVTVIDDFTFASCQSLRAVTLPSGITEIGKGAFGDNPALTTITIPESVTAIGDMAFYGTPAVTDIYWNAAEVTGYGENVFGGVGKNTDGATLTFGDSVVTIPDFAFYCDDEDEDGATNNITDVIIGDSCETIGGGAFNGLASLESVDFGESVKLIGVGAFANCSNLSSIELPDSVEDICYCAFADTAFYNNPSNWENGVLYSGKCLIDVNDSVPADCTVKAGTKVIADSAFSSADNPEVIRIPTSVRFINDNAFSDCPSLTDIWYDGSAGQWDSIEISGGDPDGVTLHFRLIGGSCGAAGNETKVFWSLDSETGELIIGGTGAMADYSGITTPWGEYIGTITSLVIEDGVTNLCNIAFWDAENLTSVDLGSVKTIGEGAFFNCPGIQEITIPATVTEIGEAAFAMCSSLSSVTLESNENYVLEDGVLFSADGTRLLLYPAAKEAVSYTISDTVTSVDQGAFALNGNLETVVIGDGVTRIPQFMFHSCTKLSSVTIGKGVKTITDSAFWEDTSLRNIRIPSNVENITRNIFSGGERVTVTCCPDSAASRVNWSSYITLVEEHLPAEGMDHDETNHWQVCPDCGEAVGEATAHTYEGEWQKDADGHWQACSCGAINKTAHTPKAAVKENETAATYITPNTWDDVVYCEVCNYEISRTQRSGSKLVCDMMPGIFDTQEFAHNADVTVKLSINGVPAGAKVYIDGNEATVSGSVYSANLGKIASKTVNVQIKIGDEVIETALLPITVDTDHAYGDEWQKDADGHWQVCSCGFVSDKENHTPKAAVEENVVNATYTSVRTWDEVVYCSVCNYELSRTQKSGEKLVCNVMPDSFDTQEFAHNADVTVKLTINGVPSGAKVYIDGNEATVSGSEYSAALGKIASKTVNVQIKLGNEVLETALLPITVNTTHTYEGEWQKDADGHWQVCSCGFVSDKENHTPKAAVKENETAATYTSVNTWDEVVYCSVCNYELSRTRKSGDKLVCNVMPDSFDTQEFAHNADVNVKLTISDVPSGAKVYIDGNEASVSGSEYSAALGKIASKTVNVQIKLGNEVLETALLPITVNSTHTYEGEWQKDADGHWKVCSCGDTNKTAHTPKAAVEENVVNATYTSVRTWDEVVYCSVCNYELSRTQKSGDKLVCNVMPDSFTTQEFAHNADVNVKLTISDVPADAKVYIDGKEASVSGSEYSAALGKIASKTVNVQIKLGNEVLETALLPITVNTTHTYEGEWQKDADGHWKVCSCGDTNKTAHTPKAAVEENVVNATYTSVRTWDEVVYCEVCGYEISRTQKSGDKLVCNVMPDSFDTQSFAHNADVNVKLTISDVPADAKVYIDGKEATVSGSVYSAALGKIASKTVNVQIKIGGEVIETALLPITVNTTHTYEGEWQKDADGHWKVCSCGDTNKTAHTPKAAVEENVVNATYTSVRTWDEVVYCEVCGYEISRTQKSGTEKLICNAMPDNYSTQSAAYKTIVTVSITINNVPSGAKVYIDGKEAKVSGNTYSADLGQLTSGKTCKVEIKQGGQVIEESSLKVDVDDGFFAKIVSFFSNFLFNLFKWKETTVKF